MGSSYIAYLSYRSEKEFWVWFFGFIAVIFNPLIPLYMSRNLWTKIDLVVGIFMVISIFIMDLDYPKNQEKDS
jgi:hypothetical protein